MADNVLIRCDAGGSYGLGHVSRCITLSRALERHGMSCVFVLSGTSQGQAFASAAGQDAQLSAHPAGTPEDEAMVRDRMEMLNCSALILDSRDLSRATSSGYRGNWVSVCIDDEALRDLQCNMLVNYHPWVGAASYPPQPGRELLAGPAYNLVAEPYFECAKPLLAQRKDPDRLLLTMGGEDPGNHTCKVIETCHELLSALEVDIVIGPSHPGPGAIESHAKRFLERFHLHHAPSGLHELVRAADIAISAGGTTCYELCAARVPTAVVAIEPHQEQLAESLRCSGAVIRIDKGTGQIDAGVLSRLLYEPSLRGDLARAAGDLFPRSGADVLAGRIAGRIN